MTRCPFRALEQDTRASISLTPTKVAGRSRFNPNNLFSESIQAAAMANETPNNGQFNPQFQFNPAAGLMGRMNANGVNAGMQQQIRNMYGTPTMANAMPNLNPGAMGQNPALSLAQRQAMAGGMPFPMNTNNPAFAALQQRQFQQQQMMQHQQQQLQLQQFQQQQLQQQQQQQQLQNLQSSQAPSALLNSYQMNQEPLGDGSGTGGDSLKSSQAGQAADLNDDLFGLDSFVDFTDTTATTNTANTPATSKPAESTPTQDGSQTPLTGNNGRGSVPPGTSFAQGTPNQPNQPNQLQQGQPPNQTPQGLAFQGVPTSQAANQNVLNMHRQHLQQMQQQQALALQQQRSGQTTPGQ
ncbi:hypothetical protein BGZ52_004037, partial [Haplosporangium bisporale]